MGAERWSRVPCLERTNERTHVHSHVPQGPNLVGKTGEFALLLEGGGSCYQKKWHWPFEIPTQHMTQLFAEDRFDMFEDSTVA